MSEEQSIGQRYTQEHPLGGQGWNKSLEPKEERKKLYSGSK
jgi:hypothetical protein